MPGREKRKSPPLPGAEGSGGRGLRRAAIVAAIRSRLGGGEGSTGRGLSERSRNVDAEAKAEGGDER